MFSGILRSPSNDPDTLVSMLTNIFGFPNHMRLKRLNTFNQGQKSSVALWVDSNNFCIVCNERDVPVQKLYFHMKAHLDKQYEENLKSIVKNGTFSICCVCSQTAGNNLVGEDNKKHFFKTHYENHVQELGDYMLEKVWYIHVSCIEEGYS